MNNMLILARKIQSMKTDIKNIVFYTFSNHGLKSIDSLYIHDSYKQAPK